MIFNVYQICIALSFASTVEHVQGWRIDRRHTTTTPSPSTSSISSNSNSSISSTSSTPISRSPSSSSSSTSSSVESTSVLSLTEVVIPIKQSPAALNVGAAPTTSSNSLTLAVKSGSSESQSVPSLTSTSSTSTSSVSSIESPQHVQSASSSSSSSTDQKPIEVVKTTSNTGSDTPSKSSQTTSSTTSTSIEPPSSTITPGPAYDKAWKWGVYPWGNHPSWNGYPWPSNSTIPSNTCWVEGSEENHGGVWWRSCSVKAWKVKVSYFPTNTGTMVYPQTYVDSSLGITMVAPSIYLIVDNIGATNACGGLGPTFVDRVIAMNPADVYTLQGYADYSDHEQIGAPKVLNLDDLQNCDLEPFHSEITTHEDWTEHPLATDPFNRCSPRISWPSQIQSLGYKYWEHCGLEGKDYGLFDPPGAVPPINGGLLATQAPPVVPQQSAPAAPAPTVPLAQAPNTQAAPVASSPTPSAVQPATAPIQPSQAAPPQVNNPPPQQPPPRQGDNPQPPTPQGNPLAQQQPPPPPSTVSPPSPSSVSVVAIVAGNTISAQAGSPNIILPNGSTASVGAQVTIAVNNNNNNNNNDDNNNNNNNNYVNANNVNNIVLSVGSSGVFVASGNAPSTYYPNPVIAAQTPPTAGPNAAAAAQLPTPMATIHGEVISAVPGASTLVFKGQAITFGGLPVTLAGTDIVVTLGSSGLIVQGPGGSLATYSVPKPTAASPAITSAAIIGTVNGEVISTTAGASFIVIEGQTLKLGGPLITLSNHEVLSLGSSGIVVQAPGGGVGTIGSGSQKTSLGPAVFIADIIGATKAALSSTSTSVSGLPSTSSSVRPLNGTSLATNVAVSLANTRSASLSATTSLSSTQSTSTSTESITTPKGSPIAVASNPGVSTAPPSSTQKSVAATLHTKCMSIAALFSGLFCIYLLLT